MLLFLLLAVEYQCVLFFLFMMFADCVYGCLSLRIVVRCCVLLLIVAKCCLLSATVAYRCLCLFVVAYV